MGAVERQSIRQIMRRIEFIGRSRPGIWQGNCFLGIESIF
jgi:hypothetical protein